MAAAAPAAPVIQQPASAAPRVHVDPMVQQAAVANTNARSRSPRNAQQPAAKKSGVSSFFSRFKLPSFGGGEGEQEPQQQSASNPPLPYDPAELEQEMGAIARGQQQRPAASAGQQRVAAPRQTTAPNRPTTPRPAAQAAAPVPVAAPQVKRSSPAESHRRNELAEALADLVPSSEAAEAEAEVEAPVAEVAEADIAPPTAVDGADLPSYLQESAPVAAQQAAPKSQSLDIGEALRAEPRRQVARSTPAPAPVAANEDEELAPMPTTAPTARPSRPAVVAKRDIADAFRAEDSAMPPAPVADDEYAAAAAPQPTPSALSLRNQPTRCVRPNPLTRAPSCSPRRSR